MSPTLKSTLTAFLKGEKVAPCQIEARILSTYPLQISDDLKTCLDVQSIQDEVLENIGENAGKNYKLVLSKWNWVFRRVPNTDNFYFDININSYKIIKTNLFISENASFKRLADSPQVAQAFKQRSHQALSRSPQPVSSAKKLIKSPATKSLKKTASKAKTPSRTPTRTPSQVTRSPLKTPVRKTPVRSQTPVRGARTPLGDLKSPGVTAESPAKASTPQRGSRQKTPSEVKKQPLSPFGSKAPRLPQVYTMTQLLDLPRVSLIMAQTPAKSTLGKRSISAFEDGTSLYEEIEENINYGNLKWNDLVFSQEHLKMLKKGKMLLA